jgi:hypothetical protein
VEYSPKPWLSRPKPKTSPVCRARPSRRADRVGVRLRTRSGSDADPVRSSQDRSSATASGQSRSSCASSPGSGQGPDPVQIAQQGRGPLEGVQTDQLHALAPARSPLKTGWVCSRSPKRVRLMTRVCIFIVKQKPCQKTKGPLKTDRKASVARKAGFSHSSPLSRISFL